MILFFCCGALKQEKAEREYGWSSEVTLVMSRAGGKDQTWTIEATM